MVNKRLRERSPKEFVVTVGKSKQIPDIPFYIVEFMSNFGYSLIVFTDIDQMFQTVKEGRIV